VVAGNDSNRLVDEVGVVLIGAGYWGVNYARVLNEIPGARLVSVVDSSEERLREVARRFPRIRLERGIDRVLGDREVNAVVIATPTATHFDIARSALRAGKHVLIEKPMTGTFSEARELTGTANSNRLTIMVGHTFLYNQGVMAVKRFIDEGQLGSIYYLHSTRTHLGLIRRDVDVAWDLAPHDISIFNHFLSSTPVWVSATSGSYLKDSRADVAFISLGYPGGAIANIHVSWIDSNKVRQVTVVGSRQRIVFDDLNPMEPVRVFETGAAVTGDVDSYGEFKLSLRDGSIISPKIPTAEPLKTQCREFIECIATGKQPASGGVEGSNVIQTLEAVTQSLRTSGCPVRVGESG